MAVIFKPFNSYVNFIDTPNNERLDELVKKHRLLLKKIDKQKSKIEIEKEIGERLDASIAFSLYGEILHSKKRSIVDSDEKWDEYFLLSARNYQKIIEILEIHKTKTGLLLSEDSYQLQLLSLFDFHSSRRHAIASAVGQKVLKQLEIIEKSPNKKYDVNLIELHKLIVFFLQAKFGNCKTVASTLLDEELSKLKKGDYETNLDLYDTVTICYILKAILSIIDYFEFGEDQKQELAFDYIEKAVTFSNASLRMDLKFFSSKLSFSFSILSSLSMWKIKEIFQVTREDSKRVIEDYIRLKIKNKNYFLFISQFSALFEKKIFGTMGNTIISLPTGSGKTFLAELLIVKRLIEVKVENKTEKTHLLYLVPSRALAREKFDDFSKIFGDLESLRIKVCQLTGEIVLNSREAFEKNDVLIMTQEKFDMLLREQFFDSKIDTLIVDEFHNIRSGYRGLKLEFAILRFREMAQFKDTKIILISAIVREENFEELGKWLFAENLFQTEWRPTFTRVGILDLDEKNYLIKFNDGITIRSELPDETRSDWYKQSAILLTLKYAQKDPVLFFSTYATGPDGKNQLLEIAQKFSEKKRHFSYNKVSNLKLARQLKRIIGEEKIVKFFEQGIGVHWGFLPHSIRKIMENAVKEKAIHIIISTSTLAEGVNLPIKTIIIPQLKIHGQFMEFGLFFNLIGRAGRPFMHDEGEVILLAHNTGQVAYRNSLENTSKYSNANRNNIEDIRTPVIQIFDIQEKIIPILEEDYSKKPTGKKLDRIKQTKQELRIHIANFETVLLAMIAENLIDTLSNNQKLIEKIKIGKITIEENQKINTLLGEIEDRLINKYHVLFRENDKLKITKFGDIAYRTGFCPESCFILRRKYSDIAPKIIDFKFSPEKLFKPQKNFENFLLLFSPITSIIETDVFFKYGFPIEGPEILIEWMKGNSINYISRRSTSEDSPKVDTMILVETQLSAFSSWYFNAVSQILSFIHSEKGIRDPHGLKSIAQLSEFSWYGTSNEYAIKIMNLDISRELIRDDILIFIERTGTIFIEKMLLDPEILQDAEVTEFINNIEEFKMEPEEFIKTLHKILIPA